jgi:hypothetical protein
VPIGARQPPHLHLPRRPSPRWATRS